MSRCLMCDALRGIGKGTALMADTRPDPAVDAFNETIALVIATASTLGLENVKASMCPGHRSLWTITLMRGGMLFDGFAARYPEAK